MGRKWVWIYSITALVMIAALLCGEAAVETIAGISSSERRCFVLDAGHGGEDGGATSCTGVLESGINLEITWKLRDLLHLLGWNTRMIRTSDTSVYTKGETIAQKKISDLKERVKLVNSTPNALLVSIHQNNFTDSRYSGAQVFYAPTEGSQALAKHLQQLLVSALNPGSKRKCKPCEGVYLMQNITCPGILIECGFLSNPAEEARLRDPDYQRKLCCVIACAICGDVMGA